MKPWTKENNAEVSAIVQFNLFTWPVAKGSPDERCLGYVFDINGFARIWTSNVYVVSGFKPDTVYPFLRSEDRTENGEPDEESAKINQNN